MKIGIPKEIQNHESRVAAAPKTIKKFLKQGFEVFIESGAGKLSNFSDEDFKQAGANITSVDQIWQQSDIVLKVLPPLENEVEKMKENQFLASYIFPSENPKLLEQLAKKKVSVIAMDCIPRISRAQKMDVLSSMANISGYRSVIEGANQFGRFLNGQITAAGKIDPAKVLIIGAGVAGLAAIGTANGLGAVVRAFDTRKSVAEQIESMGAQFLTVEIEEDGATASGYSKQMSQAFIDAEMDLFRQQAKEVDIVITTALIPGRAAPKLWLKDMVEIMKPGSVVVDLAYSKGGNCELTRSGEVYTTDNGVTIVGVLDQMGNQASQLYSSNLAHLLDDLGKAENFKIDLEDDVVKGSLVAHKGELRWPLPQIQVAQAPEKMTEPVTKPAVVKEKKKSPYTSLMILGGLGALLFALGFVAPPDFLSHFTVFVLAIFVGWQVVWNVSASLHTPLMSVTNAISGIILLGGILHVGNELNLVTILALLAVFVASINIFGGFMVTHRMLKMFQKKS
jgi:H+-translocating NAD(P) transhydrogenase subunit alpha